LLAVALLGGTAPASAADTCDEPLPPYASDPAWPFQRNDVTGPNGLRASPKKVFIHYVPGFTIFDGEPAHGIDRYAQRLDPATFDKAIGGNIRERPIQPFDPKTNPNWYWDNLKCDVRRAAALGVDGFAFAIFANSDPLGQWFPLFRDLTDMMNIAQQVDPGFKILLMPDMSGDAYTDPQSLAKDMKTLGEDPSKSAYHLSEADGRSLLGQQLIDNTLFVAPFSAQDETFGRTIYSNSTYQPLEPSLTLNRQLLGCGSADGLTPTQFVNCQTSSSQWWKTWLDLMTAKRAPVALFPLLSSWRDNIDAFAPFSYGISEWGTHSAWHVVRSDFTDAAHDVHSKYPALKWMPSVRPQTVLPGWTRCNGQPTWIDPVTQLATTDTRCPQYGESLNSKNFREGWRDAIRDDRPDDPSYSADWVQIVTWNDYGEGTEIAPSTSIQFSFYDLAAYYIQWFKTGVRPTITRDVLYYFHRTHSVHSGLWSPTSNLGPNPGYPDQSVAVPKVDSGHQFAGPLRFFSAGRNTHDPSDHDESKDQIEVVAFVRQPGTVEIRLGGTLIKSAVVHGGQPEPVIADIPTTLPNLPDCPDFTFIPEPGTSGSPLHFKSDFNYNNAIVYQDLLVHGGSSSRRANSQCPPLTP
jgi:hypothetical protein